MFRNYLAAALRNLVRNRLYAAINIVGLAVGFAAALLIAAFVREESSYDTWIPNHEQSFLAGYGLMRPGIGWSYGDLTPAAWAAQLRLQFPDIQYVARLYPENLSLRRGEVEANEEIYWADPDFFAVIPLPVIAGDPAEALQVADGIVLTRRVARKYFGRDDPIGETIEVGRTHVMRVMAVLEDLPPNTHLATDIIVSGKGTSSGLSRQPAIGPGRSVVYTYFKLADAADVDSVRAGMPTLFAHFNPDALNNGGGIEFDFPILSLKDIHFAPGGDGGMRPRGSPVALYAMVGLGILIVLAATINFVNLMTARAARRAPEVGVRKASGAERGHLIVQFIGECFVYVAVGSLAGVGLVGALLPYLSAFLQRTIALQVFTEPPFVLAMAAIIPCIAVLAGAYPAFVMSRFRPARVLKGAPCSTESHLIRQFLVAAQFAILIGTVLATITVIRQTRYAFDESLRLKGDQMLLIAADCRPALWEQLARSPGVGGVACASPHALNFTEFSTVIIRPDGTSRQFARAPVDFGFFELYGISPIAGRLFATDHPGDAAPRDPKAPFTAPIVINETAARGLGFAVPARSVGETVSYMARNGVMTPTEIIGVVRDFAVDGVHRTVSPTVYFVDPPQAKYISVKIAGDSLPETLRSIDEIWRKVGEARPIQRFFLNDHVESLYLDISRQARMFTAFAGVAFAIAALGLFGLAAFTAEQRTQEIGVRKAMGARTTDVLRLLVWQFTKPVLWANVIAWPVGYFVMRRWLDGFAYHIELSPWMFLGASGLALVIAIVTVAGHAILVARAQPVTALRYE